MKKSLQFESEDLYFIKLKGKAWIRGIVFEANKPRELVQNK